ncbi:SRPBCC family protein [Streptomyces sp. 142MFCol3.1]|uniref:SRPBCC family protein n=1 Tax=Streptomyces sp. 142MFCol3.1 TaxID=1172179 RepID=UPI00041B296D|nr:SRPBCC family protein [Streptomyces sp. 142MFCol3.1]
MRLDHSFTVPATPDEAWKLFQDLRRVAPCMPGATLDTLDGDAFTGRVKVKVGAVQMSYRGEGTVTRDEAGRSMILDLSGSEMRGAGTAAARVVAGLAADPAGTLVRVRTELDITGRPAQFGRGIMAEVGDRIVQQFAARLEELLRAPDRSTTTGGTSTTPLRAAAESDAVDLGAAVLPVLLRKAAVPAAAVVVAVVLVGALRRRSR